MYSFLLYLPIN